MKNPMREPRMTAHFESAQSLRVGQRWSIFRVTSSVFSAFSRLKKISPMPNMPMARVTKSIPSWSMCRPQVKRIAPEMGSRPTEPRSRPRTTMISPFMTEPSPRRVAMSKPQEGQGKIFRRAEFQGEFGQGRSDEGQADDPDGPGDEGADGGHAQGRAGPAFQGHLVAVDAGNDRSGLAREC